MSAITTEPQDDDEPEAALPAGARQHRFSTQGWLGKGLAGAVLGFTLAIGLSGVIAGLTPGGLTIEPDRVQFHMWIVAPLWMVVLSTCFLFRSAWRAWGWLLLFNGLAFGAVALMRQLAAA